ncbi:uncharacterized protein LOC120341786 [Styela clava]
MSFTSSFVTLDGIEFKISDVLDPPKIEELSSDFRMKDPTNLLLQSEYDFSKERNVLSRIEERRTSERKMAEQEEKRRQQSLKRRADLEKQKMGKMIERQREVLQRQRELFLEQKRRQQENKENGATTPDRNSPNQDRESPTSDSASEDKPPPLPPKNPFSQVGNTTILTPLPAARKTPVSSPLHQARLNQAQPVLSGQNQIWVDFEDKEQDPFTNMELKTIDDMAELQTVLSNIKIEPPARNTDFTLPSYEEATTSNYPSVEDGHESLDNDTQEGTEDTKLSSTNPFLSDIAEISSKLKTIVKSDNESPRSSSSEETQDCENVEIKRTQDGTSSPEFTLPKNTAGLYENVSLSEVNEIATKLNRPTMRSPTSETSSVYEFAKDPVPPNEERSPLQIQFERKMSQKGVGSPPADPTAVYSSIVRPTSRAAKSPEPVPSSQSQSVAVPTGINQSNQSTEMTINPILSRSTMPKPEQPGTGYNQNILSQGQINPVLTGSNRPNQGTKLLPVSFGAVFSSMSATVLPPISSSNTQAGGAGNYVNITPGSISDPNLGQTTVQDPPNPPVPPRDPTGASARLPPIPAKIQPSTVTASSNGTQSNLPQTGHSHLYPPYALPNSTGPSVTLNSTTNVVGFTNTKPAVSRPAPPPPRKTQNGPNTSSSTPEISFIAKSRQDRAKFEETINKALSSLPKNPIPVKINKPTSQPSSVNHTASAKPRTPSPNSLLLAALSSEEREFVQSVTSMGFDTEATIRAMQKYGLDAKEVVDHLCDVQRIVEQGFSTRMVQDALEMFQNDGKEVVKYLQQAGQLMDMGFKEEDVRQALKNSKNDQALAIDQLMGQT